MELFVLLVFFQGLLHAANVTLINANFINDSPSFTYPDFSHVESHPTVFIKQLQAKNLCHGDNKKNCEITKTLEEEETTEFVYDIESSSSINDIKEIVIPCTDRLCNFPNYTTHCLPDDIYPSLNSCINDCVSIHKEKNNNYFTFSLHNPIAFKVIVLREGEYTIENSMLITKGLGKFTDDFYISYNRSVYLCLPLHESLKTCHTNYFYPEEYEKKDRKMWLKTKRRYLDIEEFYFVDNLIKLCVDYELNQKLNLLSIIHEIGYIISTIFLTLSLLLIHLSSRVKKRFNRPLQCFVIMLFLSYCLLTTRVYIDFGTLCATLAFASQFCFLSSFFWMNSQTIDLYISINTLQITSDSIAQKKKRFIFYCIYSWGLPAFITGLTVLTELLGPFGILEVHMLKRCWLSRVDAITGFLFYYGWLLITLVIDAILFVLLMIKFRVIGEAVIVANGNIYQQLIHISIKLVILMGFWWLVKVIIWAYPNAPWYLSAVDILCSFQGLFVFLIYSYKIKDMLQRSYKRMRRRLSSTEDSRSSITRNSLVYSIMSLRIFPTSKIMRNTSSKSSKSDNNDNEHNNQAV